MGIERVYLGTISPIWYVFFRRRVGLSQKLWRPNHGKDDEPLLRFHKNRALQGMSLQKFRCDCFPGRCFVVLIEGSSRNIFWFALPQTTDCDIRGFVGYPWIPKFQGSPKKCQPQQRLPCPNFGKNKLPKTPVSQSEILQMIISNQWDIGILYDIYIYPTMI